MTATPLSSMTPTDMQSVLSEPALRRWWHRKSLWAVVAMVLGALGLYAWQLGNQRSAAPIYVTEPATRGNLTLIVTANGTLQPTRSVNIGSELSGTVQRVLVDINDQVKKGQVLVELDTSKLQDQVTRSRATLAAANARLAQTKATVNETRGNLNRLEEVARLSGGKVPSKAELATAQATFERSLADELSAEASVTETRAALATDETNLSKASIRSPINGVVLTRTVDPGNAVAASLQAVTLFTIAEDLSQLRLLVNVDEADVGRVKVGQKASFTVSAWPSRQYPANITRVAYGSTITDNVVTYVTQLDVHNTDLSLRPGMTATSSIIATDRHDVLLVPNIALRFVPSQSGVNGAAKSGGGILASMMPRMPRTGARKAAGTGAPAKQVWVLRDGAPVAVNVTQGISDGRMTEITGGDLQDGMQVITDQRSAASSSVKP